MPARKPNSASRIPSRRATRSRCEEYGLAAPTARQNPNWSRTRQEPVANAIICVARAAVDRVAEWNALPCFEPGRGSSMATNGSKKPAKAKKKLGLMERLAKGPVICAEGYLFEFERRGYLQAGAFVPEIVL